MLNVGKRSLQLAKEIIRKAPEKVVAVETGKKTLNKVKTEIKPINQPPRNMNKKRAPERVTGANRERRFKMIQKPGTSSAAKWTGCREKEGAYPLMIYV